MFFLPGFELDHIKGGVWPNTIGIKLDADIFEPRKRLGEMKNDLVRLFGLQEMSYVKWERL